jgi:hypothetical protein
MVVQHKKESSVIIEQLVQNTISFPISIKTIPRATIPRIINLRLEVLKTSKMNTTGMKNVEAAFTKAGGAGTNTPAHASLKDDPDRNKVMFPATCSQAYRHTDIAHSA